MDSEEEARRQRAAARANWPGWIGAIEDAPGAEDLRGLTTVEERIALVGELTSFGWLMSGRERPAYSRSEAPGRIIRRSS